MRLAALFFACFLSFTTPALAHVKWFLENGESDLLNQPKPDIFCHAGFENVAILCAAIGFYAVASWLARRHNLNAWNLKLIDFSTKSQSVVSLVMGLFTGGLLIYCAHEYLFLVPNMPLDNEYCDAFAAMEALVGVGFILGLCTRLCAIALLAGLIASFIGYPKLDCLDLLPMYGIVAYFLIAARGDYAIDRIIKLERGMSPLSTFWSYRFLRWFNGIGLIVLGLDEKLLHPQLSLHLIEHQPSLNFMHFAGMSDATFVFCAGTAEVVVGTLIVTGTLPRLGIAFLAGMFAITPFIFGVEELWGHMAYYGVVLALLLRGNGEQAQMNLRLAVSHMVPLAARLIPGRKAA
jgi:uncharacterized membrane protein YphA (DoxX/SURF4 family)